MQRKIVLAHGTLIMAFSEECLMQLNDQGTERSVGFATHFLVFSLLLLALLPAGSRAETLPEFRPALMGSAHSLVNLIDTKGLVK
ncbi:MAG: hypothetical protein ACREF8_04595, partial [Chthoniobacterales bacterium]